MNSLTTTEKTLLKVALRGISGSKRRASNVLGSSDNAKKQPWFNQTYRVTSKKPPQVRASGNGSKMRMFDESRINFARLMSTSTKVELKRPDFLNPNKIDPEEAKSIAIKPVTPLTLPRFGASTPSAPSVTKILQTTMPAQSRMILEKWKRSMIKKLGLAGFNKYTQDTFKRGTALHSIVATYMLGNGEPSAEGPDLSQEVVNNLWTSIKSVASDKISNVRLVEHTVTHRDLNYRGIVDCVAFYEGELVVIDFKTAEKPKKDVESLYDNPLQVAAYCAALNNDESIPREVIDRNICCGLVIVAYTDGSEASTYFLNRDEIVEKYWKQWTDRLDQFNRLEQMNRLNSEKKKGH